MIRSIVKGGCRGGWLWKGLATTAAEKNIQEMIQKGIDASTVRVEDTSGGCGTMFSIEVESWDFRGMSTLAQHQTVKKILMEEIPKWHGFTLNTKAPQN